MTQVNIGKGLTLDVDFAAMPANAIKYLLINGARNVLMDAHASITKDEADFAAKSLETSAKKLDALMRGEVRMGGGGTRGDAVAREAKVVAALVLKQKGVKTTSDHYKDMLAKYAADPRIIEKAKARVAEANALDIDVEI